VRALERPRTPKARAAPGIPQYIITERFTVQETASEETSPSASGRSLAVSRRPARLVLAPGGGWIAALGAGLHPIEARGRTETLQGSSSAMGTELEDSRRRLRLMQVEAERLAGGEGEQRGKNAAMAGLKRRSLC
jgi:hypothetical protein